VKKPTNHVTRGLGEFANPALWVHLPVLDLTAIAQLEKEYPASCLARGETVEEHLRYAGKVELIAQLRQRYEASDEDDLGSAERAS
jgi:hypothetical protein